MDAEKATYDITRMARLLVGDTAAEIPKVIAAAKDLIENLSSLTGSSGALGTSLANLPSNQLLALAMRTRPSAVRRCESVACENTSRASFRTLPRSSPSAFDSLRASASR